MVHLRPGGGTVTAQNVLPKICPADQLWQLHLVRNQIWLPYSVPPCHIMSAPGPNMAAIFRPVGPNMAAIFSPRPNVAAIFGLGPNVATVFNVLYYFNYC